MSLFAFDKPYEFNACLSAYGADLATVAQGFKDAAELALEGALQNQIKVDPLAFPILYLYRHHLEVRLKQLMAAGNYLSGQKPEFDDGHDLNALWERVKVLTQKVSPNWFSKNSSVVEAAINDFHNIDKLSVTFRYTVSKKPKQKQVLATGSQERDNLVKDIHHINLVRFKSGIEPVVSALEDLSYEFQERVEYYAEDLLTMETEAE